MLLLSRRPRGRLWVMSMILTSKYSLISPCYQSCWAALSNVSACSVLIFPAGCTSPPHLDDGRPLSPRSRMFAKHVFEDFSFSSSSFILFCIMMLFLPMSYFNLAGDLPLCIFGNTYLWSWGWTWRKMMDNLVIFSPGRPIRKIHGNHWRKTTLTWWQGNDQNTSHDYLFYCDCFHEKAAYNKKEVFLDALASLDFKLSVSGPGMFFS